MSSVLLIAEAGVNHNGSLELALEMVDAAAAAGADAVKFQTFQAEALTTAHAPKARYQRDSDVDETSQREMLRHLELDEDAHRALIQRCAERGVRFLSSPFDLTSIELLCRLGVGVIKVPSGEVTNLPYLRTVGALGREILLSTGMAEMEEVRRALEVLESSGTARQDIVVLQCTTEYPTPPEDVNLRAMVSMRAQLRVRVGISDHTAGTHVACAAVALGACVVEKHFTLSRELPGPDQRASLEPTDLARLVEQVRQVEVALGDSDKRPTPGELENAKVARKSIVAARDIEAGDVLTEQDLTAKRPGTGLSPMLWDEVIGTRAVRAFKKDEQIDL